MKTINKKGFTVVELVIVIAIIAVLAAVLIPTFASIIKKAEESAYLQERTNKRIEDLAEKVENREYLSWEDVEKAIAVAIANSTKNQADDFKNEITAAISAALAEFNGGTGLTEAQVKKIVEKALEGIITTEQVQAIVDKAIKDAGTTSGSNGQMSPEQIQTLINNAINNINIPSGISQDDVKAAINSALSSLEGKTLTADQVTDAINTALAKYAEDHPTLSEDDVNDIVDAILAQYSPQVTPSDPYLALVNQIENDPNGAGAIYAAISENGTSYEFDNIPEHLVDEKVTIIMLGNNSSAYSAYWGESNIVIDANGHSIVFTGDGIGVVNGATLTLRDNKGTGSFTTTEIGLYGSSSTLFIESGTYNISGGDQGKIWGFGGHVYITGGSFDYCPESGHYDGTRYEIQQVGDRYNVVPKSN